MSAAAWVTLAVVVLLFMYAVAIFNRLVRHRNLVREGWSGIDVQLRRRNDLIPNLIETVKGYAAHEKSLFEEVTAKRAHSVTAGSVPEQAQAQAELSGALGRLFAVAEAYPALKADANFQSLQNELSAIEDQLQMARRYYNGTARELNIVVESFPSVLVARSFGFKTEPYYELVDTAAAAVPKVSF